MNKCLIFGNLNMIYNNFNFLHSFHKGKKINIVGFLFEATYYTNLFGFQCYKLNELENINYNYIIILYENDDDFFTLQNYLLQINPRIKILNYKIFFLPYIDIKKYLNLFDNTPTIFANNCNGGLLYHNLFLKFNSPLINLWIGDEDYLKFLKNPKKYLNSKLIPFEYEDDYDETKYPLCLCNDIVLHCTHYSTHKEVIDTWENRKKRVNFNDIFIIYVTTQRNWIEQFVNLPYTKKICICPFEYQYDCVYKIDLGDMNDIEWHHYILKIFSNKLYMFNLVNLLHDSKIDKISY